MCGIFAVYGSYQSNDFEEQRSKFLEILRNSTDRNEKIYAERQLVALEEQKLSSISQDEQFYLRMNPEDYEVVLDLHREHNRGLRELNSLDDPDGAAGRGPGRLPRDSQRRIAAADRVPCRRLPSTQAVPMPFTRIHSTRTQ